jgi:hypothetical protein
MTSLDLSDDEAKEQALKRLKDLCENPRSEEIIDESLTEEDQEFIKNHRFPDGSSLNTPNDNKREPGTNSALENLTNDEWYSSLIEKYNNLIEAV